MLLLSAYTAFSFLFIVLSQSKAAILPSIYPFQSKDRHKGTERNLETQPVNDFTYDQYLGLLSNLSFTGAWFNMNNATQEGDFFYRNYGFITFQANVTSSISENSESDSDIVLEIYDGNTIASNYLTTSFYFQHLTFNQEDSSFSGNITVSQDYGYQGTSSSYNNNTKCSVFLQLVFTNATSGPLTNLQNFSSGGGIQLTMSNSNCSMSLATNILTNQPLATDYLERFIILMSIVLFCVCLFELYALRNPLTRNSQIKTMGLWGILLLLSWYLSIVSLNIIMLIIFDNFWFLILILSAIMDCLFFGVILARYRMLIDRELMWADQRSRNIKFWIQYLFALAVAWAFAISINSLLFCYVYLIGPLFLIPQIINKFRNPNRARAYWSANLMLFIPQIFFMIYFFVYEDNLLGIKVNLPLTIAFFSIYLFELLVLALLKLKEDSHAIDQNNIALAIMAQGFQGQDTQQSASEDPNQSRKPYESQCCPICLHDFKSPPMDPRKAEVDSKDIDVAVILKCGHSCHRVCLLKWFEKSKTCPSCRKKVKKEKI